jgi:hypothetical protein
MEYKMNTQTIDHTTLTKMAQAGAVRSAHIIGQAGGWGILVKCGMTEHALTAQRSHQVRVFKKLETLVNYLKGVGIARFEVDAANYDADSVATHKRPDRAIALKTAHQAMAYNQWLEEKVTESRNGLADGKNARIDQQEWKKIREQKMLARSA